MLTPICGFVDRCYLLRSWHIPRLAIFLLWIPTIITESQEVLATLIFIGTSPVSLDLWLFPSFFVCSKPVFVVYIPHVVSSVLFFIASLQCWLVFLSVFWWWIPLKTITFKLVIPLKTITIFEFSMGLPINSCCYHDFPGQGPTPWAAPWGCHGAGGREVMGWPQVLMVVSCKERFCPQMLRHRATIVDACFLQDVQCLVRIVYGAFWTDLMEVNHAEWNLIVQYTLF